MKGKILDQKGNLFRIKSKSLALYHPSDLSYKEVYLTVDALNGKTYSIYKSDNDKYTAISWNRDLKLYINYQLRFIRYEKDEDIRFSYERTNRYNASNVNKTSTKTIRNDRSSNKLSKRAVRK